MSEPLRLRKERIFPAYGTKGLNVPARHAVLSNESEMLCGDSTFEHRPADFGLDFPVRKSVHAAPLVPLAVSPRIVVSAGSHRTTFGRGLLRATNEEEPQWARATTGR